MGERAQAPPAATLRWVERSVGRGARVTGVRRLFGGIVATVHRVSVVRAGQRSSVVLKRWTKPSEWQVGDHANEVATLAALAGTGVPAPALIASSDGAETDGVPTLLMERSPGAAYLTPDDHEDWLRRAAAVLPLIHAADVDARPDVPSIEWWSVPDWSARPDLWKEVHDVLAQPPPSAPTTFVHGDFQLFNLLWSRRRLSAVIDWTHGARSCPDVDAAHMRLNLAVMYSAQWAEDFRRMYEADAGRPLDPWWDLYRLKNYGQGWKWFIPIQIAGRRGVDLEGMDDRVETVIAATLRRL